MSSDGAQSYQPRLLVICAKRYNGHELWTLLGIVQARGFAFDVVSTELLVKDELTFRPNLLDRTVYDVPADADTLKQYDGICVVSGNMKDTEAYWTDTHVTSLLHAFRGSDKVCAAICCSVPTLAPIATNVKVSFFPLVRSRERLSKFGAILQNVSLTVDKRTVTAENQMITQMWAEEICNCVEGLPPQFVLVDSGYVPKGRPRRLPQDLQDSIDQAKLDRVNNGNT